MLYLRVLLTFLFAVLVIYYITTFLLTIGIFELEDSDYDKSDWRNMIPFYNWFKHKDK